MLAGWIGRDDSLAIALGQPVAELAGVISTIGNQPARRRNPSEERRGADQVVRLPGGEGKGPRSAGVIGYGVNFGRPSAARSADGVLEVPPFAPAAERCALTCVESTAVVLTTPLDPLRA